MNNYSQNNLEDSNMKRSLRPRKIENYKQMLEGDEATIKTIQDEQIELRKKKQETFEEEEDEIMDDAQIERASDDEDDDYPLKRSARKRVKRILKGGEDDEDVEDPEEESSEEEALEDLDNESFAEDTNKRKNKEKAKN